MRLLGALGTISGGLRTFEDEQSEEQERHAAKVRAARLEIARRHWTEITPAERLVARGPWLVDTETDFIYIRRRGETFEPGRANLLSGEGVSLAFYVNKSGDVVPLERVPSPRTYSEHAERQARRAAGT